ncbi:MAG: hypothetical protein LBD47_06220 [Treponema sp.]|nr:hypothetical protein [Treponema sp.]
MTREEKVSEFTKTTMGIVIRSNVKSYLQSLSQQCANGHVWFNTPRMSIWQ